MAEAEDAQLVDKSQVAIPLPAEQTAPQPEKKMNETNETKQSTDDEMKRMQFDNTVANCLNAHKEKGGIAFDILKAVISNKLDTVVNGKNFSELVNACYALADTFKLEMDARWTRAVAEISHEIYGNTTTTNDESTQAVQPPKDASSSVASEPIVAGPETIN